MSEATGSKITRVYANFRGVDFRGEEINLVRSPDSLNVWKDYKNTESIRTRPCMELVSDFDATVYGVFFYKDMMLVHSGTRLYKVLYEVVNGKVVCGDKSVLWDGCSEAPSNGFVYDNIWYFKDRKNYLQYDGVTYRDENGNVVRENIKEVEGYVPTTFINRTPTDGKSVAGGEPYQDVNMLQPRRINTFVGDGVSRVFHLAAKDGIDKDFQPIVRVNGEQVIEFTVDYDAGKITFTGDDAPPVPDTTGQSNVSIEFRKTIKEYRSAILNCSIVQVFDSRVFFSGNKDYPNVVWHCSLDDPSYICDTDMYLEGMDEAQVTGMVAGNNALWVFREPSEENTTVFYHTPTIDEQYGKIYPAVHSSVSIGCIGRAINFNDDIVFFSERGLEGISGDVTTEQVVAHRSSLVDRKMIAEPNYKNMILEEWEGYLFVFIGDKAYLADSRTAFTNEDHIEYEWFYWNMEKEITCAKVYDGVLYLGTADGVYALTDSTGNVESYWVTPKDKFKYPHMQKTTNKRGCVAEATGDITVYAKTEKTAEFEPIGTFENVKDYFVSRIKKKKFKDIQLKFHSNTRFSLETVTLECFIGAYVKR